LSIIWTMAIHIGQIIKEKATEQRLSQDAIGQRINTTKQNVGNIYKRSSIDTQLLLKLCAVFEFNFFELYFQEEPLKSMRNKELEKMQSEINSLQDALSQREQRIRDLEESINDKKKMISFLEEEREQYRKR
jgi:transcriptional regulator with XRE-family HTH domain